MRQQETNQRHGNRGQAQSLLQGYRLSPVQRRLWLLQQTDRPSPYRAQCVVAIWGSLDEAYLKAAIAAAVRRHEILRTVFRGGPEGAEALQLVTDRDDFQFEASDLRGVREQEAAVEGLALAARQKPVDLEHGPALDCHLVVLSAREHKLILTLPALCADAGTLRNLAGEISREYQAGPNEEEISDEPLPYVTSAQWLNDLLEAEEARAGREYWRKQSASTRWPLTLPLEQPLRAGSGFRPERLSCPIERETLASLEGVARRNDATLADCLLAGWCILLWRHSGQADLAVATAFDGRMEEELETAFGPFAKYLPIVCHLRDSISFAELLGQIRDTSNQAWAWQDTFAWDQAFETEETVSPDYCFDFAVRPAARQTGKLSFLLEKQHICAERFKVKLSFWQSEDGLAGEFHFDDECLTAEAVQCLSEQYSALLKNIAAAPDAAVGELTLLGEVERQRLLVEWNNTGSPFPDRACVQQLFEQQCAQNPRAVAISFGDDRMTYGELNRRSNRLATHLRKMGVRAETLVGLCVGRSPEVIVGLLGILKAGGAYLPLDPELPVERLSLMIGDAQPPVILTREEHLGQLPSHWGQIVCLDSESEFLDVESEENPPSATDSLNLAYVMYTSGSTGTPKAVCISHQNIVRLLMETGYTSFGSEEVFSQLAPLSFDASTFELWGSLLHGGRLVLAPPNKTTLEEIAELVSAQGVTTLWLTTGLFHLMADEHMETLAGVKQLLSGGDVMSVSHVERTLSARAGAGSAGALIICYGPTENTTFTSCRRMESLPERKMCSVPLGKPIANTEMYVLDDGMKPSSVGIAGEIYIGGAGLSRGYLNHPEITAEKFLPHPFSPERGARLYRTGDLGRLGPEGEVEFIGRRDRQVKIRGFRVELEEIEEALRALVKEAVVMTREEGMDKKLVAYLVAAGEGAASASGGELRSKLMERLPDYMIPSHFVWLDEMPLNANGKIDRRALAQLSLERAAADVSDAQGARTPIEEVLCGIWAETLGITEVGAEESFFDLGGHSLLATQVVSRIRAVFAVELPLRTLFEQPTVRALAKAIEQEKQAGLASGVAEVTRVERTGDLPLSFAQERLWFLDQLEPGNAFYNVPAAMRLQGRFNPQAMEQTFSEIIRRHETLRTVFQPIDGRPVQRILAAGPVSLPLHDLSVYPEAERQQQAQRLVEAEASRPFDLATGPLCRAQVLKLDAEEHVLMVNLHHIVTDGWSTGVLIREVVALYEAYANLNPSPLPDLNIQYSDFAVWQRNTLAGEYLDQQFDYWKTQLAGAPKLLALPTDRPRPSIQSFRGSTKAWELPAHLSQELKALSRSSGASLYMTLLAAYKTLLYRYSGQSDIVVGSPIANRNRAEIENLIGFFVNTLALRTKLAGRDNFSDLLACVRNVALEAYLHQELPFEKLVEELAPDRSLSHQPLFQAMFIFNNAP
ncbi:MAG: amino acid adenylation domain-containing protein, partial [Acidobacteriota bacterium]